MKNSIFLRLFISLLLLVHLPINAAPDIVVTKKNVEYHFVPFDHETDNFAKGIFKNWENDTFEVFDKVKNKESIAIDVGAWIGTTAIWLSNNFYHVIAVEPDNVSLFCLQQNLVASKCNNVTICDRPVLDRTRDVVFGPRGKVLNQSISYVKEAANHPQDYIKKSITFKQLIHDYVYNDPSLAQHKVSFIKCDIEGGEEAIMEDILHFAYNNRCKVYMSFHHDWWTSKRIDDYAYLFDYFHTSPAVTDVVSHVKRHPFCSLLLIPKHKANRLPLVKKNMPAVIIGYNQLTYIRNMVKQLERYTSDIVVVDNHSTYQPLLDYYDKEFGYTLLRRQQNEGHEVYQSKPIQSLVGDLYVLTDPDLRFNPQLPQNFIQTLLALSNNFEAHKVGFALNIARQDLRTDVNYFGKSIKTWESQFWKNSLKYSKDPKLELYSAAIDTTFCLVNKRFASGGISIRVAGDYTCDHLPWYKNFQNELAPGEYEFYLENNRSSNWFAPSK
jgi:FkbM family methyltransferase